MQTIAKQLKSPQEVYSTKMKFWCDRLDKQVEDTVHMLLPYETIEAQIVLDMLRRGSTEPDISAWCSLPEGSPLIETKRAWLERVGITDSVDNVVLRGLWGDGAVYHTRDTLNLMLLNVFKWNMSDTFLDFCLLQKGLLPVRLQRTLHI